MNGVQNQHNNACKQRKLTIDKAKAVWIIKSNMSNAILF